MDRNGSLLLLIKNPISLLGCTIVASVVIAMMSGLGLSIVSDSSNNQGDTAGFPVACQQGKMNTELWESQFKNAGAFTGKSDSFLSAAIKNRIDPVLLASIAFHETGRGSSKMVRDRNNPGGLYNSSAGSFFVYSSLDEGIDAMASNLYKNYISLGLFTIDQIGSKYAPIGVENDPNNLNVHWVPNVSQVIAEFGGLTANCTAIGFSSGFSSPVTPFVINDYFGTRVHPITGKVHNHNGIDFKCTAGQEIRAVMAGTVISSTYHYQWGNYVKINHGDKDTLYAHMTKAYVKTGDQVSSGTPIGACGTTGESTGVHLHLELYVGPTRIDPLPYFQGGGEKKE